MSRASGNSTCRHLGHDWMLTAAADWRVCRREGCPASERLVDGQWVSNADLYRAHRPLVGGTPHRRTEQADLWERLGASSLRDPSSL